MSESDKSKQQQKVNQGKKDQNVCLGRVANAEYNFKQMLKEGLTELVTF